MSKDNQPALGTFNGHPVITGLPYNNTSALIEQLQTKGWAFMQLDDRMLVPRELTDALIDFFKNPDRESKMKYSAPSNFGYSHVDHKEGIRVLTGNEWYQFTDRLPPNLLQEDKPVDLHKIVSAYDDFSLRVSGTIADFFAINKSHLAVAADLSAAYNAGHIGMLDTAYYYNNKTDMPLPSGDGTSVDDVNCVPHYDPGFLSFSFLSTVEGLQLLDPTTNQWVNGPVNTNHSESHIGVVWAGQAATKVHSSLKAGVHRVVYPLMAKSPMPRLTMWYEMCTVEQINLMHEEALVSDQNKVASIPNLMGKAGAVKVKKGDTKQAVLRRIERTRGIPMSKIMRLPDMFRAMPEEGDRKKGVHG